MKQLIEKQKKGIYNIIAKLDNGTHSSNQLHGTDEALWNWHKQSLKQFIDGLITWQEEEVRHPLETISHLKELKEELN